MPAETKAKFVPRKPPPRRLAPRPYDPDAIDRVLRAIDREPPHEMQLINRPGIAFCQGCRQPLEVGMWCLLYRLVPKAYIRYHGECWPWGPRELTF